ncbi:asparagine synthase (glutamine-hydrolyzing) [Brevibacillus laterosporus]|uniref:asparagine synthase (glutamine-hydrolyzing) n=1 Tax=Brevibacillus laterosporus TaxID=1465 RepID=UPI0035A68330
MCGIAGIVNFDEITNFDKRSLEMMSKAISHRGPDDEQFFHDRHVAFVFRRLSIVDLKGGGQPFFSEDKMVCVMVNGEIYNHAILKNMLKDRHVFKSESDCEIIVHLYEEMGLEFLQHLNGMYSIAIYDKRIEKLILAKDRFGIKPLFYHYGDDTFTFSSEIKGLFQYPKCPRIFDWKAALQEPWMIAGSLTNFNQPISYFKEIEHLPASSYLVLNIKTRECKTFKYWDISSIQPRNANAEQIIEEYIYLLEDSVKNCLMSDVEVGVFLSGGIDSIIVSTFASKYRDIPSFSVLSQSTLANGDSKYSYLAARHLCMKNYQVLFSHDNVNYTSQDWKSLLWLCENPMTGPEQLYKYHLHKFAKSMHPGLKVMLTGQGSDEFNGGYSKLYSENNQWEEFIASLSMLERRRLLQHSTLLTRWDQVFTLSPFKKDFYYSLTNAEERSNDYLRYVYTKYRDIQMYNCWHEDRTAAGNHIENRVPFLDHRLVELTTSVPIDLYPKLFLDKQILRKGMQKRTSLSQSFINRPKVPFFYGEGVNSTHKTIMKIILQNNCMLIEEAFEPLHDYFDINSIINIAKNINCDLEFENIEFLTRLINMGLLDRMAKDLNTVVKATAEIALHPCIRIEDWESEEPELNTLFTTHSKVNVGLIPTFHPTVEILKPVSGSFDYMYISIEGELKYIVERLENKDWFTFLLAINNKASIEDLLIENSISFENIKNEFEELLQSNVLSLLANVNSDTQVFS